MTPKSTKEMKKGSDPNGSLPFFLCMNYCSFVFFQTTKFWGEKCKSAEFKAFGYFLRHDFFITIHIQTHVIIRESIGVTVLISGTS